MKDKLLLSQNGSKRNGKEFDDGVNYSDANESDSGRGRSHSQSN
jgi:hypothetical protein